MIWCLLFLLIGYAFGYFANKKQVEEAVAQAKAEIKKQQTVPVGVIKRPSAVELKERQASTKERESIQAMRESLQQVPELNKR